MNFLGLAPNTIKTEPLIAVLNGEAKLFVHCYTSNDMMTVIEVSKEYNFNITAFHHAIEAWQIFDTLAKEKIVSSTFAQSGYFKMV